MSQTVVSKSPTLSPNLKLVGRYSVLRELRRDRYTTVYLAFDPVLNRELVVKAVQLHPASGQDRAAHERVEQAFMRQAQAAGRLHHPHIVTVFDAGHVNRIGYIALEKVDGKLLDELLTEGYRPGFLQAADIVARVADAVEFAHARAIPHGHLSSSRIYLQGAERTPKVMGFGGWIDNGMTGDFELHGTDRLLPYFGDELSGEARRKDIRALGALLFLLLTGTRPDVKTLRAHGKASESPILQLKPNAPLALAEIAEQALELGGSRVFATAAQVRNALTTYLWGNRGEMPLPNSATITGMPARLAVMPQRAATMTVATIVASPARSEPARESRSRWRTHAVAGLVAAVAIAAIAGIGMQANLFGGRSFATGAVRDAPANPPAANPAPSTDAAASATLAASNASAGSEDRSAATSAGTADFAQGAMRTPPVRPAPARAAVVQGALGVIALAVAPWGTVYVNGDARGTTPPLTQLTLPAGRYTIEIRNGERTPYIAQVDVTPERPQQIRHRFQ
jgi:eukaryotic-like serine/threonine-protein kinase